MDIFLKGKEKNYEIEVVKLEFMNEIEFYNII